MASKKVVTIQPLVGTLNTTVPPGDETLDHLGARRARRYLTSRRNWVLVEDRAAKPVSKLRAIDLRRPNAPIALALARQAHPSGAGKMRNEGRLLATKLRQAGAPAE
jgi:hypothetical protein